MRVCWRWEEEWYLLVKFETCNHFTFTFFSLVASLFFVEEDKAKDYA